MNYTGKFDAVFHASDAQSLNLGFDSVIESDQGSALRIPDAHLLFSGDFQRSGNDLIIADELHRVVVPDYFKGDKRPQLVSPEGAQLDPAFIDAVTGHTHYAQAGAPAAAGKVVGHVAKMTGSASVVRNGVTVELNNNDTVYQNDVVQTGSGSTLGLVMVDGTTFNLTANARLMLNDLTYDAASTSNTSLFTLVQGAASFVAGQTAKTGDMKVATPVASIGIRGTAVILDISSTDGKVSISVVDQQDNQVHAVQVFNTRGDLIGTVTSNGSSLTLTPTATFEVIAEQSNKTPAQVAQEFTAFQQVINTYDAFKAIAPNTPPPTDGRRGDANPQSPTKYAATTVQPNNLLPTFTDVGGNTKPTQTASAGEQGPATSPTTTNSPTTQNTQQPAQDLFIPVSKTPPASIPFVVTPPTVGLISVGQGNHFGPVMSADGRYVTYDPDGAIYLFDRQSGNTSTIASPAGGLTYGSPSISSDGRYVVYEGHSGANSYIYLYGTNPSDPAHYLHQTLIGPGSNPEISGNGSKIVAEHGGSEIVIYNQQGQLVGSITPAAVSVSGTLWKPAISADGNTIAFWSSNSSAAGGSGQLFTYNISTGAVSAVASTAAGAGLAAPSLSADGHLIAYQAQGPGGHSEIYLYDLTSGHVVFQTSNAAGSYNPVISPDGHFIIFASDARLTADDTNNYADTYVVNVTDPSHPTYKLVSALADGTQGNAASNLGATISAGGLYVAFGSNASNLSTGNSNTGGNIFVVDPTSGHSAIIEESLSSPNVLTASGSIAMTGGVNEVKLSVSDPSKLSAQFSADGNAILWTFSEAKSDFAALAYGQNATQTFQITLNFKGGTTTVPVVVTVHNGVQPSVAQVDFAPVANPVTLSPGQQNTSYVITQAALLSAVGDIDGPSLSITSVTVQSGGGKIVQNPDSTWTYTPDPSFSGQVVFNYTASDSIKTASSTASLKIVPPLAITAIAPDSGTSGGDFITNSTSLTVSGTNGPLMNGETIQVSSDNGVTWTNASPTNSTTNSTTWSLTDPATHSASFTYQVRIVDATNGVVNTATHAVVIDTTAPTGGRPALTAASDSGSSSTDNVTNVTNPTFTVALNPTVAVGDAVQLLLNGSPLAHDVAHTVTATDLSTGAVSLTVTAGDLGADGSKSITARLTDAAGNSSSTPADIITLDTTAPSVTALTDVTSNGNNLGAGQTVTFTLTASEALTVAGGATLTLSNGGAAVYQSGSGTTSPKFVYTVAAGQDIADLKVTGYSGAITDAAGNALAAGGVTLDTGVKIDTTAPTGGTPVLAAGSDSGSSSTDNITNVTGPTFTVALNPTVVAGDTVQLLLNGSPLAHPVVYTVSPADIIAKSVSLTVTAGDLGADGSKSITAKFTDAAGNSSTTPADVITLDTTAPVVTIGNAGGNTNQTVQTITGTVDLNDVGATVLVLDGITAIGVAQVQSNGSWSANVTLNPGSNSLTAHVTDAAGNLGISNAVAYVLNTVGPTGGTPVLAPSSDSGVSSSDGVTNVQAPTFTVSLGATVVAGATVQLLLNGSPLAHPAVHTVTAADIVAGSVSLTVTAGDLGSDGSKSISARLSDLFGNSNATGALAITLDTTAPTGGTPALTAASDSGSSSTDNVTNVTNPTFTVALNPTVAAGDTVQLLLNGAPLAHNVTHTVTSTDISSGSVSLTVTAGDLGADGSKSITARFTDPAGNSSTTAADVITLDTTAPTGGTPALTPASDSGSSSTDNITSVTNPTFTVALNLTMVAVGDTVQLLLNGSPLAHPVVHTVTAADLSAGSVSLTVTAGDLGADGSKSITARFTDPAGNSSTTAADVITLDTTAPAGGTPALTPASDSGSSSTDNITSVTNPTFTVALNLTTVAVGDTVQLLLNGSPLAHPVVHTITTADLTAGSVSLTVTAGDLGADGSKSITARFTDPAGNSSTTAADVITLDTTTPTGGTPALTPASDSGSSSTDNVTNVTNPTFKVALNPTVAVGDTVQLLLNGAPLAHNVTHTVTSTDISTGSVSLTVTAGDLGADGSKSITARLTDAAGNSSSTPADIITLDTTAPAVTSVTAPSGDFGPGKVIAFTVNFSEAVTVDVTGGAPKLALSNGVSASYVSGSGTNALVFNYTVGALGSGQDAVDLGTAVINALSLNGGTIRDAAGNAAALSGANNVNPAGILQIDTTAPTVSITTSGATTSQSVQTISGTSSDVGATVKLYDNSGTIPVATTVVQGNGTWSASVTLGPGTNSLIALVTDGAGNIGISNAVAFTLPGFTVQWTGPDGGSWGTGANWSTTHVPGATDDVLIGVPDNVVFNGASFIDRLYSAAGSRLTVSGGAFTVTGANPSSLLGSLFVQDATVELAAVSGAINVGFGGTTGLLKLDSTVSSTSTAAVSATSQGAAVSITAAAGSAIASTGADAIDVNAAGGPVSITANGAVSGGLNGISAIQNGLGDITVTESGMVQGLNGRGIFAEQNTTGSGNVLVNGTGTVVGGGRAFSAIVAQNLNAANNGNVTVSQSGGTIIGGHDGIHVLTNGNGFLNVNVGANTTVVGSYLYGIEATANGAGSIAITTDASSAILSGSVGINAYNQAAVLPQSVGVTTSSITVTANGTINSGTMLTGSSTRPAGILAGYRGGTTNTSNPNVFGDVKIDNFANINAAGGDGIRGYNFGSGNVTVNDHANTTINAKDVFGISASSIGGGKVSVTTAAGDIINSGSSGIQAINQATSIPASANSTVSVMAFGTINSGVHPTPGGSQPQGISAGYFGANGTPNTNINGSVSVDNFANVNARAGWGINAYNWGNGSVSVVDEANTSVSGAQVGIAAASLSGGSGSGSVSIAIGPNATITAGALNGVAGINAISSSASNIRIGTTAPINSTTAASWKDVINSGGTGIQAGNQQTSATPSQISITTAGTINSGFNMASNGNQPGGIWAGYNPGNLVQVNTSVHGDVIVDNWANINAPSGVGIGLYNFSAGMLSATVEATSTISAINAGINAFAQGGGAVTIVNQGSLTAMFGPGITTGSSGAISVTNSGSITSPGSGQAPVVQISNSASATFTNSGSVTSTLFGKAGSALALSGFNSNLTVNNTGTIAGNVSLASGTFNNQFNNQAGGVWRVNGFSWLGGGTTPSAALNNAGNIFLSGMSGLSAAAIFLLTNDGAIAVQSNSVAFINANVATDAGKSGTFQIGDRSGLEIGGSVASGQTISFQGKGVLTLDNPSAFGGTIDGLAVGDTLTLHGGLLVAGASISGSTLTVTKADNTTLSYGVTNVQPATMLNVLSGDKIVVVPTSAVTISGSAPYFETLTTAKAYIFSSSSISGSGTGIGINGLSLINPADTIFININQSTAVSMSGGGPDVNGQIAAVNVQTGGASIVLQNAGTISTTGFPGIFASSNAGSLDILDYGNVAGSIGIRALTTGAGLLNIVVGGGATITGSSSHGIFATATLGAIDITTIGNVTVTSSGVGILAQNQGTAVAQGAVNGSNSSISIVTATGGAINAGGQGISAGYLTGTSTPAAIPNPPNTAVYGDVSIDDGANITAGSGSGIAAYNYGTGSVSVALEGGTTITATAAGFTTPGTTQTQYGISAFTYGVGKTTVTTGSSSSINSGGAGLQLGNQALAGSGTTVTVVSLGSIHSGASNNNSGSAPAGIQAGYNPGLTSVFNPNVAGDVSVFVGGNIVADAGDGINTYNYAVGNIAVDVGFNVSIQAMNSATSQSGKAPYGIGAFGYGPGNINVTTSSGDTINSGSSGINVAHQATATTAALVTVSSAGTVHSGSINNNSGSLPSGIAAGFLGGTSAAPNLAVHGNVIINNAANITADAGYGINAYHFGQGDITVNQAAGTTITGAGVQYGIYAHAEADGASGNVAVNVYQGTTVNAATSYGIFASSKDAGNISVVTSGGDVINSAGVGINAANQASAISSAVNSSIVVTAAGTINSGTALTGFGSQPAGVLAGYIGGATNPGPANLANSNVFGEVVVNNFANINAAAGDGIRAYNYGVGDITVGDFAGAITALGAAVNPPNGSGIGIAALNYGMGSTHVSTNGGTVINSGGSGIAAVNKATTVDSANAPYVVPATSLVSVQAFGTILSGTIPTATVATDPAAGIVAGFNPNNTNTPNNSIVGNVAVDSHATVINTETFTVALTPSVVAGSTIKLLLAGSPLAHPVTHVVTQADVSAGSVNLAVLPSDLAGAGPAALSAQFLDPSQVVIGSATPTLVGLAQTDGIRGVNYGIGEISITNEADGSISAIHDGIAALGFDGGNVVVTNSGSVVAATAVHAMTTGAATVLIDNSGYLGGVVTAYNAAFTNEAGGDWSINGTSQFTGAGTLTNLGRIESNGTSVIGGLSGLTNSGIIEVETGSLKIAAPVTGAGTALIYGATLEFAAASDTHIQFNTGPSTSGTLVLDDVAHFTGSVTGFTLGDTIDLVGIAPANVGVSSTGGLHVNYGTGSFALLGNYDPAGFSVVSDTHGGTDIVWNHQAPFIATNNLTVTNNVGGTTTVTGLQISDPGASTVTLDAATGAAASGTTISPTTTSGSLTSINAMLTTGVTYNPGATPPNADKVMLTATDNFGASEAVNFVFYQSGNGSNVSLVGTSGNDVVFATGGSDVLTGGAGHDQFVFQPSGGPNTVQHTVTDFTPGIDTLDLRQFPTISATAPPTELQVGNDTLVTLDSHTTLLLKNVTAASLHASDFILHA